MPSKSPKQARFMAAVAHNPAFAKKAGVPQSVGEEFNSADEGTGILKKKSKRKPAKQASKRMKAMRGISRKVQRTYGGTY